MDIYDPRFMSSVPPAPIAPGSLLDGRYQLKGQIGEGGMGSVYLAEDIELGRRVAIKLLHGVLNEELLDRLFREARAAARSDHPAVVTTYDCGTDPERDVSYVVMEYLQGESVAQRIGRVGPLPGELVQRIALETADALVAVHAAGVIHRDLKPSNLFLATRGRRVDELKLLDFGVAKQLDLATLTATGQVYGTPMYMAPEQLLDSKHVDPRCDLYSLGVLLWECALGRPPFSATNIVELVASIQFGPEFAASDLGDAVHPKLAQVIARCLRRRPDERFPTAQAVCTALGELG